MSHFTTLKIAIANQKALVDCLESLGYTVDTSVKSVKGYSGNQVVNLIVKQPTGYNIGFQQNFVDGGYDIIADWWGVKGIKEKAFTEALTMRYAERTVEEFAEENRFELLEVNERQDHRELVMVRRFYS